MPWVLCVKNIETGRFELVTEGMQIDADDPRYDEDVHFVPVSEHPKEKNYLTFGVHTPLRECVCRPKIEENCFNRTQIIHREQVN